MKTNLGYLLKSGLTGWLMITTSMAAFDTDYAAFEDLKKGFSDCASTCTTMILHNDSGTPIKFEKMYVSHGRDEFEKLHKDTISPGQRTAIVHSKCSLAFFGEGGYVLYDIPKYKLKLIIGFYSPYDENTTTSINYDIFSYDYFKKEESHLNEYAETTYDRSKSQVAKHIFPLIGEISREKGKVEKNYDLITVCLNKDILLPIPLEQVLHGRSESFKFINDLLRKNSSYTEGWDMVASYDLSLFNKALKKAYEPFEYPIKGRTTSGLEYKLITRAPQLSFMNGKAKIVIPLLEGSSILQHGLQHVNQVVFDLSSEGYHIAVEIPLTAIRGSISKETPSILTLKVLKDAEGGYKISRQIDNIDSSDTPSSILEQLRTHLQNHEQTFYVTHPFIPHTTDKAVSLLHPESLVFTTTVHNGKNQHVSVYMALKSAPAPQYPINLSRELLPKSVESNFILNKSFFYKTLHRTLIDKKDKMYTLNWLSGSNGYLEGFLKLNEPIKSTASSNVTKGLLTGTYSGFNITIDDEHPIKIIIDPTTKQIHLSWRTYINVAFKLKVIDLGGAETELVNVKASVTLNKKVCFLLKNGMLNFPQISLSDGDFIIKLDEVNGTNTLVVNGGEGGAGVRGSKIRTIPEYALKFIKPDTSFSLNIPSQTIHYPALITQGATNISEIFAPHDIVLFSSDLSRK